MGFGPGVRRGERGALAHEKISADIARGMAETPGRGDERVGEVLADAAPADSALVAASVRPFS